MADLPSSDQNKSNIENYFGFRENPFGVTPDPRYFYDHSLYLEGLSQLIYGIQARKGIVLLTGEGGTGKTMLLRKLIRQLPNTRFITVSSRHLTADGLLELTLQGLGISTEGSPGFRMMQQLEGYLIEAMRQKCYVALLIDEAQELSDNALQGLCDLSNLETDKDKLLQIVLVGQPELAQTLAKPAVQRIKQRIAMHHRLTALPTMSDVEQYICHRLKVAGDMGPDIFDRAAIEGIWAYTAGTPRLINVLCDNSLPIAASAGRKKVTASMVDQAASLLILERRAEVPTEPSAIEPTKAKLQAELVPWEKPDSNQPEMREAKIPEEPTSPSEAKEPKFLPSREAPPTRRTFSVGEEPEGKAARPESAEIMRLKAAMAAISLQPPRQTGKETETTINPRRAGNSDRPQTQWLQPAPLSSDVPRVPTVPGSAVLEGSSPGGARMIIAKDNGVPTKFFDFMVHEATEALGPIGEFVVQEHISGMGETRETFPRKKLHALVEAVSSEIGNKQMRANFEVTMRREVRGFRTF